jgi:parallel beta-helix repeat protein/predicted outer membrane repeat protein
MDGGTFSENITSSGGGVAVGKNGIFHFNAGEIINNTASHDGGGILLYTSATLNMNGGKISGNNADVTGGGICAYVDGIANINNGSILNNTATLNGGGIALYDSTTLNLKNSTVSGNNGNTGGGIYLAEKVIVNITESCSIINNTAKGDGGGIFAFKTHEHLTTSADTVFDGNKARAVYTPPENVLLLYPNIQFASTTIMEHPLNNYDINYLGKDPIAVNINYDANGGTGSYNGPNKQLFDTDTVLSLSDTGIVYEDYCFVSWNTKADGSGTEYAPGDIITLKSNVKLYAQWIFCGDFEPDEKECFDVESCHIDHCSIYKTYVPLTVKPYAKTDKDDIKVTCRGSHKVIPGHKDCESMSSHEFTIVQDIIVSIPVQFGAEICLGELCDEYVGSCVDEGKYK